jgi:dipeptidyl-peptidase 4
MLLISLIAVTPPSTRAEATDYKETTSYAEVVSFLDTLAKNSGVVRLGTLGTSHEGRKLPLVFLSDPPVANEVEAVQSGKPIVFVLGNIHAGEVDGKEALLMLARDMVTKKDPLLKELVFVFAPIFNADGNEKLGQHRPEQAGPERVGERHNAQDYDLNRDFIKLETPEVRSLVAFLNKCNPHVFIDMHTTNGSFHRYKLTYEGGYCPAGDSRVSAFTREALLPDATVRLKKVTGYDSYFYGNFNRAHTMWETVPPTARYGFHYVGLRNRVAILSESYSYASFKERTLASYHFVRSVSESVVVRKVELLKLLKDAETPGKDIILRDKAIALGRPVRVPGFVEEVKDGKRTRTDTPKDYEVLFMGGSEATLTVKRPVAYLVPAECQEAIATLKAHGIVMESQKDAMNHQVEVERIDKIARAPLFEKHRTIKLETTPRLVNKLIPAGTVVVKTEQSRGALACYLLEARSADGLATWNLFDNHITEGQDYPVMRLK